MDGFDNDESLKKKRIRRRIEELEEETRNRTTMSRITDDFQKIDTTNCRAVCRFSWIKRKIENIERKVWNDNRNAFIQRVKETRRIKRTEINRKNTI